MKSTDRLNVPSRVSESIGHARFHKWAAIIDEDAYHEGIHVMAVMGIREVGESLGEDEDRVDE